MAFILGDQLDPAYPSHLGLEASRDVILMAEVAGASQHPPSHVQRTVLILSAMRHHAAALRAAGWTVDYTALTDPENTHTFRGEVERAIARHRPDRVVAIEPGSFAVAEEVRAAAGGAGVEVEFRPDPHFLCSTGDFALWAQGRKELVMEYFYREMRRRLGVLMEPGGTPAGGQWNYDKDNRKAFTRAPRPPAPPRFEPDAITGAVIGEVRAALPGLPGRVEGFNWPVTRAQAREALDDFVRRRLPRFGDHQDAMWTGQPTLYHSLIAAPLNLRLLDPREVVAAAVAEHEAGRVPLNAAEGFIRQVIGWREFIRGVYHLMGPGYAARNALGEHGRLPAFYWTGQTDMACMADSIGGVLDRAYAHHISRLMVTGNFALIAGVDPGEVNGWYLGMYADAFEWVTTPNTVGMAMHADGGVVGTKPYAASGKYIQRMSNFCENCRYDVSRRHGEGACPFNTFYWDFLIRHRETFRSNRRMAMILKNVDRMAEGERVDITSSAAALRAQMGISPGGPAGRGSAPSPSRGQRPARPG